jgi:hypothetical protein
MGGEDEMKGETKGARVTESKRIIGHSDNRCSHDCSVARGSEKSRLVIEMTPRNYHPTLSQVVP